MTVFLAHEAIVLLAAAVPFTPAPTAYVKANETFHSLAHFLFQWDALWYISIARSGYARLSGVPPLSGTAFFPFVPLVVRALGVWPAWVLTQLAFAVSLWLAVRLFRRWLAADSQIRLAVWLFALNPAALYYSTLYAEPWTVLFALLSVDLGLRRRFGWAAVAGGLTALTQATGALVGLFPLVMWLGRLFDRAWRRSQGPLVWGLGCLAGTAAYAVYLGIRFGHPLLFASIQHNRHWGATWGLPWTQWWQGLRSVFTGGRPVHQLLLWVAVTLFLAGAAALWAKTRPWSGERAGAALYATVGLLVSLSFLQPGNPLYSTVRIASVYFPLYAGIARLPAALLRGFALVWFAVGAATGALLFTHQWWWQ